MLYFYFMILLIFYGIMFLGKLDVFCIRLKLVLYFLVFVMFCILYEIFNIDVCFMNLE